MADEGYTIDVQKTPIELPKNTTEIIPYNKEKLDAELRKISITDKASSLNVVQLIVSVFNSTKERRLADGTIVNKLNWLRSRFIPYIKQLKDIKTANDDLEIFNSDYLAWLKTQINSGRQIAREWNTLQTLIKKGCKDRANNGLINAQIIDLKDKGLIKIEYDAVKTLSQLYPDLELENDLELLIGCQELMIWYLNEMNSVRQAVQDNLTPILIDYYEQTSINKKSSNDRYANFTIGITTLKIYYRDHENGLGKKELTPDYTELTELIKVTHRLKNNFADEMMFAEFLGVDSFLKYVVDNSSKFTLEEMREFVSHFWHGHEKGPKEHQGERSQLKTIYRGNIKELHNKGLAQTTFPSLSFPVMPSKPEKLAMTWLLAAGRSQTSGIDLLTVEDNVIHNKKDKTIQIVQERKYRHGKSRASDQKQGHETPVYKNDNHYFIYTNWINLIEKTKKYVADFDGKFIPNAEFHERSGGYRKANTFLWLASLEGTITNQLIRNDFKDNPNEGAVLSFLRLVRRNQEDLRKTIEANGKRKYELAQLRKKGLKTEKKKNTKKPQDRIGPRIIAQTRCVVSENEGNYALIGHNETTHKNTYQNRSTSPFVNGESITWAADVGNAFIEEAKRLYTNTGFLTVSQAKKALQLQDITGENDLEFVQQMIDQAENDGFVIELSTVLRRNEMSIVVMTPWTCALIKAHANHLEQQIKELKVSTSEKILKLKTKQIYLTLLLERFPKKIIKEANEILEDYTIPFARAI